MNAALITYYLRWRLANRYRIVVESLMQIIDCCSRGDDSTLCCLFDWEAKDYFYGLFNEDWMLPERMERVKVE